MHTTSTRLAAILAAAFTVVTGPAVAGDWHMAPGSIKDVAHVGIPVPAPVPIPEYAARWYLRIDATLGFPQEPSVSDQGAQYANYDPALGYGLTPFGIQSGWLDKDFEVTGSFGVGVGYYWGAGFRTDLTGEARTGAEVKVGTGYPAVSCIPTCANGYEAWGSTSDRTSIRSGVILLNAYYDFIRGGRFTPYIGAGIGVGITELNRRHMTTEVVYDNASNPVDTRTWSDQAKKTNASLAAAATAGFTFQIWDATALDFSYRYLYIGGSHVDLALDGVHSRLKVGDLHEHQLRAGLRWDIF